MEKNRGSVLLRVLLSFGIIFFGINSVFFYIDNPNSVVKLLLMAGLIVQLVLGIAILSIKIGKKAYQYFIALIFIGTGVLNILVSFVFPFGVEFWWPLYPVVISIFLFMSGYKKYKKIKFGYVIPGVVLFCMGVVFSLFSFGIIKIPFKVVAVFLGPIITIVCCLVLIIFFMLQQRHKELVIKDEDSGDFSDEELSFPKID